MAPPKPTPLEAPPLTEQVEAWTEQLSGLAPPSADVLAHARAAALWRAIGSVVAGDPAKAPATWQAAAELVEAPEEDASPVGQEEVATAVRRAVRRGLGSDDPKVVAAAVALWRSEASLAAPQAVGEELDFGELAALAAGQAERMAAAGEVGL